jgi:Ribonuclease G/E
VKILVSASPGEVRVAVAEDDDLLDYAIHRPGAPDGVGDLHRGRIIARVPAMAGAFVALDGAEGFLPDTEGAKNATEGAVLGVRVTRAPQGGKGPRLTARLLKQERALVGSGTPALLVRGPDPVLRFAFAYPDAQVVVDDPALAAELRPTLGLLRVETGEAFDEDIESAVDALADPVATLPGGARLSVYPTPALTALDLDLGSATTDARPKQFAQKLANIELCGEIAHQIRLRNLGGAILLDFAGMRPKERATLARPLETALALDPLRPRLLGFTALGLAEIVRPRIHPPLAELLAGPHAAGLAALRGAAREVAACPQVALSLRAAPAVVTALRADPVALPDFARRAGRPLELREDRALTPLGWALDAP